MNNRELVRRVLDLIESNPKKAEMLARRSYQQLSVSGGSYDTFKASIESAWTNRPEFLKGQTPINILFAILIMHLWRHTYRHCGLIFNIEDHLNIKR